MWFVGLFVLFVSALIKLCALLVFSMASVCYLYRDSIPYCCATNVPPAVEMDRGVCTLVLFLAPGRTIFIVLSCYVLRWLYLSVV